MPVAVLAVSVAHSIKDKGWGVEGGVTELAGGGCSAVRVMRLWTPLSRWWWGVCKKAGRAEAGMEASAVMAGVKSG